MVPFRIARIYDATPSDGTAVVNGTCGVHFRTAGNCSVGFFDGTTATIAGLVGQTTETGPLQFIRATGTTATVSGVIAR